MEGTENRPRNGWQSGKGSAKSGARIEDAWGPPGIMGRKVLGTTPTPTTPICEMPLPETDEDYAEYYQDRISAAQNRQLYPLLEDLADWINKCLGKCYISSCILNTASNNSVCNWDCSRIFLGRCIRMRHFPSQHHGVVK